MRSLRLAKSSRQEEWHILCWSNSSYIMKSTKVICWKKGGKKAENAPINCATTEFMQHTHKHTHLVPRKPLPVSQEPWELLQFARQFFDVRRLEPPLGVKEAKSTISTGSDINNDTSSWKKLQWRNSQNRRSTTWQSRSWNPWTGSPRCRRGPSHPLSRHLWWHQTYQNTNTTKNRSECENINQWGTFIWFIIKDKKKERVSTYTNCVYEQCISWWHCSAQSSCLHPPSRGAAVRCKSQSQLLPTL